MFEKALKDATTINSKVFNLAIVGAGVTGTALLKLMAEYSNMDDIVIIEKAKRVATINSHPLNNAQTSHDGSTETNYGLDHALDIQLGAKLLRSYAETKNDPSLFHITNRMALAIGDEQVNKLRNRHTSFLPYYPDLRLAGPAELADKLEPNIMLGRNGNENILAMVSNQGYAINYQALAEHMLNDAIATKKNIQVLMDTGVESTKFENGIYNIQTKHGIIRSRFIVFAAGSYSLKYAQEHGHGTEYTIFPVAGSFVTSQKVLNGKVYPMQIDGMPFAAIHGDPDILDPTITRWGPTTKPLPLMERHHYHTIKDYLQTGILSWAGMSSAAKVLWERDLLGYVLKNELYDIPYLGMHLFLPEVQKVVPTLRYSDLTLRRKAGGIRPQLINMNTGELIFGDSWILGYNAIYNTTPSPGASICLLNGMRDGQKLSEFSEGEFTFDRFRLMHDLGVTDRIVDFKPMYEAISA